MSAIIIALVAAVLALGTVAVLSSKPDCHAEVYAHERTSKITGKPRDVRLLFEKCR